MVSSNGVDTIFSRIAVKTKCAGEDNFFNASPLEEKYGITQPLRTGKAEAKNWTLLFLFSAKPPAGELGSSAACGNFFGVTTMASRQIDTARTAS